MATRPRYAVDPSTIRVVRRVAAVAGLLGIFAIAIASLVPGHLRPHAGLPGPAEHFAAYAVTGLVLAIAYDALRVRVTWWVAMTLAAASFETLQNLVPGRGPAMIDAVAGSSGLAAGLVAGAMIWRAAAKIVLVAEAPPRASKILRQLP